MEFFITRPSTSGAESLSAFREAGIQKVTLAPLLDIQAIHPLPVISLDHVSSLIFTSANGVRHFHHQLRDVPVFAIGDATREAAEQRGFTHILTSHGNADDLYRLILNHSSPDEGTLYHGAGIHRTGQLKERLEQAGFKVQRQALYEARACSRLPASLQTALASRLSCGIAFYSPRTAKIFVSILADKMMVRSHHCLCLSQAVADEFRSLNWRQCHIAAPLPTNAAMIALALALALEA